MKKFHFYCITVLLSSLAATSLFADGAHAGYEKKNYVLENKNIRIKIPDNGKNFLIEEMLSSGRELLSKGGDNTPPWIITYKGVNGENPRLFPSMGEYKGIKAINDSNSSSLIIEWDMHLDNSRPFPVRMRITLKKDSETPEWNINAELPKDWVITEIEFPRISFAKNGNCKVITSYGYGIEYDMVKNPEIHSVYPSYSGGMQLVMMYDNKGTLFYSTRDKNACGKEFHIESKKDGVLFYTKTAASYSWSSDGRFALPWSTIIGYNKSSWENTVEKWYRPFTFETMWGCKTIGERKNITDWIKNADVWIRPKGTGDSTMNAVRKAIDFLGSPVGVHWYWWHKIPYDTKYPEYFPPRNDFYKFVQETQSMGGYVTPYINGRLWDPSTDSYKRDKGSLASCRKPDGTLYSEIYGSKVINTVTCPASPIWQDIQKKLVDSIIFELGTSGVYIDQVGAAASEPCYATNHGHSMGGGSWWPYSYRSLITKIRNSIPEHKALTTEENAECYIDLFDMMLTVNTEHGPGMKTVPLFPLVYSDRAIYCGYSYMPSDICNGTFRFITMRSLLWGAELGWIQPYRIMDPKAIKEAAFLKKCTDFRRNQHDLLLYGRFLGELIPSGDNPVLNIPGYESTHVVMAAIWADKKGKKNYIVVNMDDKTHIIRISGKKIRMAGLSCRRI